MNYLVHALLVALAIGSQSYANAEPTNAERIQCNQDCINLGLNAGYFDKHDECWCYDAARGTLQTLAYLTNFKPSKQQTRQPTDAERIKCNKDCTDLKHSSGVYKDDQCLCYNATKGTLKTLANIPASRFRAEPKHQSTVAERIQCHQVCMNLGQSAGYYYTNDQCWCYNATTGTLRTLANITASMNRPKPTHQQTPAERMECHQKCINLGQSAGYFYKYDECWCYDAATGNLRTLANITASQFGNEHPREPTLDERIQCHQDCINLGLSAGYFYKGEECWCYDAAKGTLEILHNITSPNHNGPTAQARIKCNQDCKNLGLSAGYFYMFDKCWCYNATNGTLEKLQDIKFNQPYKPITADKEIRCNKTCASLRMTASFFRDGDCWCYGNDEIDAAEKEISKECDVECLYSGMSGGFKHHGRCWCIAKVVPGKVYTKIASEENHQNVPEESRKNADSDV